MKILSALIMVYSLLIMMHVILSWIPNKTEGSMKIQKLIKRFTDPYMSRFQRISWLKFGMLDFSPMLGLILLSFILYITQRLSIGGFPSIGELIVLIIQLIWGMMAFLAVLLGILMIIRLIALYAVKGKSHWTSRLDGFLFPLVSKILGVFTGRSVPYPIALGISAASLFAIRILIGQLLGRFIYPLLMKL